ncbi:MAG: bifunctional enoyl-CoA hydratase/phosphate acetyltransferase [Rhodospirillales bacterium]|nr:bifunctional enoyl-CoA hydratase/phosphate acetyltransferase [Rhodospirillales bacterium]
MADLIENKTFDEIAVGMSASVVRALKREEVETWAAVTGNVNFIDPEPPGGGDTTEAPRGGGQALWGATLFSTVAGTQLPGIGSVTKWAQVRFLKPVPLDAPVTATVTVTAKRDDDAIVVLDCRLTDANGDPLIVGTAEVEAPRRKLRHVRPDLPRVELRHEDRYLELVEACDGLPALSCAVVHPCSADALRGALEAAERRLITPVLVGPAGRLRAIAEAEGIDVSGCRIVDSEHSHHSAELAVRLVNSGDADALMKGSLHTDELLHAVLAKPAGLATERRLSHCFIQVVPTYPRPIIVTDAAINIHPDLRAKRDIVQNAIELAHALGMDNPRVAILAAVETINPDMPSTVDAASLCKMAERGQIRGGVLDGPLAFDNAINIEAARIKGIVSPVAGRADILVVPNLEAGNILVKNLTFMAGAEAAGVVLGARAPIVLTSRADSAHTRLASAAVAVLMAAAIRDGRAFLKTSD